MRRSLALLATVLLAACGGDNPNGNPDAGSNPDLAGLQVQTYNLQSFTVPAGQEMIKCYYVPPDGVEKYVSRFVVDMAAGSHHLVVGKVLDNTGMAAFGPVDCINGEMPTGIDGLLPGSQQPHMDYMLPDGVAVRIGANEGLWFQSHYINATGSDLQTAVSWQLTMTDPAKVTDTAGIIFYSNNNLMVKPGMSTASKSCKAPADMFLLTATGHMHKRGIAFDALVNTTNIFHTNSWDEPNGAIFPSPGYAVKAGDVFTWTCTYDNMDSTTYTFGNSAQNNEMCIFPAMYYPAINSSTLFFCQAP